VAGVHGDQPRVVREEEGLSGPSPHGRGTPPDPDTSGSGERADRYRRQRRVAGVGDEGQRRLDATSVLILGVGALGTHSADHLVRAGFGRVCLVDRDVVETDNLHRQVLFTEADAEAERPKSLAAADALRRANRTVRIEAVVDDFQADSWDRLPFRPDLVVDGTDNFATRLLLNDLCVRERIPYLYGGAVGTTGRAAVFRPDLDDGPCLRCLIPEPPPTGELATCETAGVLAPVIAQIAAFQVAEAIKLACGVPTARGLFEIDVWTAQSGMRFADSFAELRDPDCPSCGTRSFPALDVLATPTVALCGRDAVQVRPTSRSGAGSAAAVVDLTRLHANLTGAVDGLVLDARGGLLRFAVQGHAISVFASGRALIRGTRDPARARALYDRYVGAC
jgi:molybdopterin/thiamine biosynthesis adenylyltransferase